MRVVGLVIFGIQLRHSCMDFMCVPVHVLLGVCLRHCLESLSLFVTGKLLVNVCLFVAVFLFSVRTSLNWKIWLAFVCYSHGFFVSSSGIREEMCGYFFSVAKSTFNPFKSSVCKRLICLMNMHYAMNPKYWLFSLRHQQRKRSHFVKILTSIISFVCCACVVFTWILFTDRIH